MFWYIVVAWLLWANWIGFAYFLTTGVIIMLGYGVMYAVSHYQSLRFLGVDIASMSGLSLEGKKAIIREHYQSKELALKRRFFTFFRRLEEGVSEEDLNELSGDIEDPHCHIIKVKTTSKLANTIRRLRGIEKKEAREMILCQSWREGVIYYTCRSHFQIERYPDDLVKDMIALVKVGDRIL